MKKLLIMMAISILALSCSTKNDPEQKYEVTFKLPQLTVETQPMNSPRRAPQATILDDENGTALTDLYVFDGTTQLAHQTNSDPNFGTVTLNLSHGAHNLSFICTRSTGISYENGVMSFTSLRPTFGKLVPLTVSASTGAQSVVLDRISGLLSITITDEFPAGSNEIEFIVNPKYNSLDVETLCGTNGDQIAIRASCASKVGLSDVYYTFNLLCPSLTEELLSDITINVYNSAGAITHSVLIENVRQAANTKTLLSGNLFEGTGATITVNSTWNANIVGSF